MAPQPPTATANTRKRKKPHKPSKTLAKKPTNPVSTKTKKKHKQKKRRPPTPPSKQDQTAAAAAAADELTGGGVLLSAAMPPARQLEFLLRSFERAAKMRLSSLELDAYSGGLKMFTKECRPVKLFAKHLKVEEQVELLKARVNIACGTPSRIKKLIDMEALSLSRLKLVVLDMQRCKVIYLVYATTSQQ